jgi:Domain of unknown function (DUF6473)
MGYQEIHWEIVDYQCYFLDDTGLDFRGPKPENLQAGQYFVCLGAAQTFGCLCPKPYPSLLQEELQLPTLNLGYGGAGPYFFLKHEELWKYINQAKFVIVQVMSGRSESNSLFDSGGLEYLTRRADGVKIGAQDAYQQLLEKDYPQNRGAVEKWRRKIVGFLTENPEVKDIINETRQNWVHNHKLLLEKITVPKILFWFSKRKPDYRERYSSVWALFGEFPQLINQEMMNIIKPYSDDYVECISRRGSPELLISRFTGKPVVIDLAQDPDRQDFQQKWSRNKYYPSPEMQIDAAMALAPICRKYL